MLIPLLYLAFEINYFLDKNSHLGFPFMFNPC